MPDVSILMLTHNAPSYVELSVRSLERTIGVDYELIVLDNASDKQTRRLLKVLYSEGKIDQILFNERNDFFAKGNNLASRLASKDSKYYLLLNSDIEIKDPRWLINLLSIYPRNTGGVAAYGAVLSEPARADGYCFLIDRTLYDKYKLDERFAWWWSITKLESQILSEGKTIRAVVNPESQIYHYGGKSGKVDFKTIPGMDTKFEEIMSWFEHAVGHVEFIKLV